MKSLFSVFFVLSAVFASSANSAYENQSVAGGIYRKRFALRSAAEKLTDNLGAGRPSLYGTRNFRAVLNGVYYRGGANNSYNVNKRPNINPLQNDALKKLCEEGFKQTVYLYPDNFETAPKNVKCRDFTGAENTISYQHIYPYPDKGGEIHRLHVMINDHIRNPRLGPIYDHCWNGWHASGFVAATALMQFCDFTVDQAVAYWNLNTDGNDQAQNQNERVRGLIRTFVKDPSMRLRSSEKAVLCPKPGSLEFSVPAVVPSPRR